MRRCYNCLYEVGHWSTCNLWYARGAGWIDPDVAGVDGYSSHQAGIVRWATAVKAARRLAARIAAQGGSGQVVIRKFARRGGAVVMREHWFEV